MSCSRRPSSRISAVLAARSPSLAVTPSTLTLPAAINSSALRRLATPPRPSSFCSRSARGSSSGSWVCSSRSGLTIGRLLPVGRVRWHQGATRVAGLQRAFTPYERKDPMNEDLLQRYADLLVGYCTRVEDG